MILCLGKDRIIIQEGSWSETGRVNYYKHQGVIRNMGGPAAGHSHFLTVTCRLLTSPKWDPFKIQSSGGHVSNCQMGILSWTWDCYPVTKDMRYFVRQIEGIEWTGISGTFFTGENPGL